MKRSRVYGPMAATTADASIDLAAHSATVLRFDDFYRSARDDVARALAVTIGDAELAAEATDEAMARAFTRWAVVSTYERPAGWVYRVGLNWSRSVLVRRRRHREIIAGQAPPRLDISDPSPVDDELVAALASLPEAQRAVVVCRLVLDMSNDETAAALKIKPGTVKSRLSRAIDHLRNELSPDDRNNEATK